MDGGRFLVSAHNLYARLGTASAPVFLDVRRTEALDADNPVIIGAVRHGPDEVDCRRYDVSKSCPVIAYAPMDRR